MPVDLRFIATSAVVAQVLSVDIRTAARPSSSKLTDMEEALLLGADMRRAANLMGVAHDEPISGDPSHGAQPAHFSMGRHISTMSVETMITGCATSPMNSPRDLSMPADAAAVDA
jgi:hypothetical protein